MGSRTFSVNLCPPHMSPTEPADSKPLTLTEQLATERNRLANQRTLLAYIRTALGLVVSGTGFSKFLDAPVERLLFFSFIPIGVAVLGVGLVQFWRQQRLLAAYLKTGHLPD